MVRDHYVDNGNEKLGPIDWVNVEVISNMMEGIIEGTQLYTSLAQSKLNHFWRL